MDGHLVTSVKFRQHEYAHARALFYIRRDRKSDIHRFAHAYGFPNHPANCFATLNNHPAN